MKGQNLEKRSYQGKGAWDEGPWIGEHLTEKPGQGEDRRSRRPDEGVYLAEGLSASVSTTGAG